MDRPSIPRINAKGLIVGDQWLRLAICLPAWPVSPTDGKPPCRTELLSDLVELLERRTLPARQGALQFVEHRMSSIAAMAKVNIDRCTPFVPYGLMFAKKWIWKQGGRPRPSPSDASSPSAGRSTHRTKACPGRHWVWRGHALALSPAHACVFVPDTISKATMMAFGVSAWKIEVLEDYFDPQWRTGQDAETTLEAASRRVIL